MNRKELLTRTSFLRRMIEESPHKQRISERIGDNFIKLLPFKPRHHRHVISQSQQQQQRVFPRQPRHFHVIDADELVAGLQ